MSKFIKGNYLNWFRKLNYSSNGFAPILFVIAIALIAIPVTSLLLHHQQDIRQRASQAVDCMPNEYMGGTYCTSANTCYDEWCNSMGDGVRVTNYTGSPNCDHCTAQYPPAPTPTPSCFSPCTNEGASRCNGNFVYECSNSCWTLSYDCGSQVCKVAGGNASCVDPTPSCDPGQTWCAAQNVCVPYGKCCTDPAEGWCEYTNSCVLKNANLCNPPVSCGSLGSCNNEGLSRCSGNSVQECVASCWTSYDCGSQVCKVAGGNASCVDVPTPTPPVFSCSVKYNDPTGIYDCKTSSQCSSNGGTFLDGAGTTCPQFSSSYGCCKQNNGNNNCGSHNCSTGETCIQSYSGSLDTMCIGIGVGSIGSYCAKPDGNPNNLACVTQYCSPDTRTCSIFSTQTSYLTSTPTPQTIVKCTFGQCSGSTGKCIGDKAYICDGTCYQFGDICDPGMCNNGECKKSNGVGCGLNEDCASNNCQSKGDGSHICCPAFTSWCSYTNMCSSNCDTQTSSSCSSLNNEYCSADLNCGGNLQKPAGNLYCSLHNSMPPQKNTCCINNPNPTPTSKPYQCASYGSVIESCYDAFSGCPAGYSKSPQEPGTSCNINAGICCVTQATQTCESKYGSDYSCYLNSSDECKFGQYKDPTGTSCESSSGFQLGCCKPKQPVSCAVKYGDNKYQCLATVTDECKFGTQKDTFDTTCGSDSSLDMACCKPPQPYSCEGNGGRCTNPFSSTCNTHETQYSISSKGTSCSISNQVCCMPVEIVKTYDQALGFRCGDGDIIYDLFAGKRAIPEEATENCGAEGKVCSLTNNSWACVDKSTESTKKEWSTYYPFCGSDNKLYSGKDPLYNDKNGKPVYELLQDCTKDNKVCTQLNGKFYCAESKITNLPQQVERPPRVKEGEGINQGDNKTLFDEINNSQNKKHKSKNARCGIPPLENPNWLYPPYDETSTTTYLKDIVHCEDTGKLCIEIDQDVVCANPPVVDTTPITHFYCGDRKRNILDSGLQDKLSQAILQITVGLVLNKITLGTINTGNLPIHNIKFGGGDVVLIMKDTLNDNPDKYINEQKPVKILKKELTASIMDSFVDIFGKNVGEKMAQYIAAEPVVFLVSPNDVALFIKTAISTIGYQFLHQDSYDYWFCQGDQVVKRRINLKDGQSNDEVRSCPKNTGCKLFDEYCVVCTNKPPASANVLGTSTNHSDTSCPLKWLGDANCDGKVNSTDLLIFRTEKLSKNGTSADFNSDGKLDSSDLDNFIPTN